MKKVITVIIALIMLVSLVSCNKQIEEEKELNSEENSLDNAGQENGQSKSDIISTEPQESKATEPQESKATETQESKATETQESESTEPQDCKTINEKDIPKKENYDFVKEPFKNKDGIIDLSEYAPYGEVIENEELRQELIPVVKNVIEAEKLLWSETNYRSTELIQENKNDYSYYAVLSEFATTKQDVINYFNKVYTDNYISKMKTPLEEQLFNSKNSLFKVIDNKLCIIEEQLGTQYGWYCKNIKIKRIEENIAEIVLFGRCYNCIEYKLRYMTLVHSEKYGWRLEEEKIEDYRPLSICFNYLYIKNADKINIILTGTDPILKNEEKVIIERNGVKYEKIEKFMTIKEMKDYFKDIFTEELAQKYIKEFIDVYYEENDCLYRAVEAEKAIMHIYQKNAYFTPKDYTHIYGSCIYKDYNDISSEEEIIIYIENDDKDPFMLTLTSLKIAQPLPLIKVY